METALSSFTTPFSAKRTTGGSFLIEDLLPGDVFTPEDFTDEQKQIAAVTSQFADERVLGSIHEIEAKNFDVTRGLMREAGDLGLMKVDVPEEYGGLELDKVTSTLISDRLSVSGSFSVTYSAHVGIGMFPLLWFGTAQQKEKYLPRLASGEWIAAYALSESSAGSDAMNIRTRATLSPDGRHYILNGEKMWISNAGMASLFTVFAKVDGEKFTAFLIEAGTPGFTVGKEEHKLGLRGSSTCPLIFSDCHVPVENVVGEIGKGHHIAFNILNVGRYKVGAVTIGAARSTFRDGVRYARERIAFGKPVTSFGLVQEKIAETAAGIYAGETALYRVIGAIDAALSEIDKSAPDYSQQVQKSIEDFAVECSILKFWCSEMLERAVDNSLQLHGGYGYVEEYPVERTYRDARVNKIFEGTNEINRLITATRTFKRATQGRLALLPAIQSVMNEATTGSAARPAFDGILAHEKALLADAKKIALFCAGAASQRYGTELGEAQEVNARLAEIIAEILVLDSVILRTEKLGGRNALAVKLAKYYAARSMSVIRDAAERAIGAVAEGNTLRAHMASLRRWTEHDPINTVVIGREIASALVQAGQYTIQDYAAR
jgi:alkylation response protein AidB-like acyl-CoA dehydrogenase